MTQTLLPVRARDKTSTVGTGDYTINDTVLSNFQTFVEALVDGAEVEYYVEEVTGVNWEFSRGVWTESTKILTRATIIDSSNAGAAVNWVAGDKTVGISIGPTLLSLLGAGKVGSDVGPADVAVAAWRGAIAQAYGRRVVTGDAQVIEVPINILTTNNTLTEMQIGADSLTSQDDLNLVDNRLYAFEGLIGAWQHSGSAGSVGDSAAYHIQGAIKVVAGVCSLVGTPTITALGEDDAGWNVTVTADDTNDRLSIKVQGAANKNVHWNGRVRMVEVG